MLRPVSLREVEAWFQAEAAVYKAGYEAKIPGYAGHPVATPDVLDSATVKLDPDDVPKDHKGKKVLNKLELTKLELAASESSSLLMTVSKEMQEKTKSVSKLSAISNATQKLAQLAEAAELSAPVQTAMPEVQAVPAAKGEVAGPAPMPYKLTDDEIPKDANGKPQVSKANIKKLEDAMAKGLPQLNDVKWDLSKKVKKQSNVIALLDTADLLYNKWAASTYLEKVTEDMLAVQEAPQTGVTKPGLKETDIPEDNDGQALLTPDQVQQLEEAAAQGKYALAVKVNELAKEVGPQGGPKFYAVTEAADILTYQLQYPDQQPQPAAPEPVAVSVPEAAATPGPKLTDVDIPKVWGKPLLSEETIKVLEDAAAKGIPELDEAADKLVENTSYTLDIDAVQTAASVLKAQLLVAEGTVAAAAVSGDQTSAPKPVESEPFVPEPVTIDGLPTLTEAPPKPKVSDVPKDNNGKPLVSKANVKKLEDAAATNLQELDTVAAELVEKMLSPAKKAAIAAIAADLKSQLTGVEVQEADGGSGLSDTIEQVDDGEVKLPNQTVPERECG